MTDTALILKKQVDSDQINSFEQASELLGSSPVVQKLLSKNFNEDALNLLNRLTELSEIPFTGYLPQVREWCEKLVSLSSCEEGFSLSGKSDYLLSCYNSMIVSLLIRLDYGEKEPVRKGIDWILNYQQVSRNAQHTWNGSGIRKYGGCMKTTPCYIGVVKAMIALSDYKKREEYQPEKRLEDKLTAGLEYILEHQLFKRLSDGTPITNDITKITYPFSYKTNVIEILRLLKENELDRDPRCMPAKDFIMTKKKRDGYWRMNASYLPKAWILFDRTKVPGLWVTYEIQKLLS